MDGLIQTWTEEFQHPNWDGYGAEPVPEKCLKHALAFLKLIEAKCSDSLPESSFGAEPDGCICFDWGVLDASFSISVTDKGGIVWAGNAKNQPEAKGMSTYFDDIVFEDLHRIFGITYASDR